MPNVELYPWQAEALAKIRNGCILDGGVGSGKSRTALAYYFTQNGGNLKPYKPMKKNAEDLIIITTALKRDKHEWEQELAIYLISTDKKLNNYNNEVIIDSWNNIDKYIIKENCFFIFDEDHAIGKGSWSKSFIKIAKKNHWIMLSATPGDKWEDYISVFIANGFYKNRTEFCNEHLIYSPYIKKYPVVTGYMNTGRLIRLRSRVLVKMNYDKKTIAHHEYDWVGYDADAYKKVWNDRWDIYKNEPIKEASSMCAILRRLVNTDPSRIEWVANKIMEKRKVIIFYNFDDELCELRKLGDICDIEVAEWNGHKHQPVPEGNNWIYLVQYTAGCEGFNCILTDTIIFFSQSYSYRTITQAAGRIDRLNTPYTDLYYYHLISRSTIDLSIRKTVFHKKNFNENTFVGDMFDKNMKGW